MSGHPSTVPPPVAPTPIDRKPIPRPKNYPPVKNHSTRSAGVSRRQFISTTGKVAALLSMPSIIPSRLLGGDTAPSNRIRVGQIGCGRIAQGHDMPGVLNSNLADYVAVCDLDTKRVADGKAFVEKFCREN